MGELAQAMNAMSRIAKCHLSKCPNGRWSFVGGVPIELCHPNPRYMGNNSKYLTNVYDTKEEAMQAAASRNIELVVPDWY